MTHRISPLVVVLMLAGPALADPSNRDGIISMDDGEEIFMDKRNPEDRDTRDGGKGIVNMGDGEEIFMDKRSPEDRDGIIAMGDGEEI